MPIALQLSEFSNRWYRDNLQGQLGYRAGIREPTVHYISLFIKYHDSKAKKGTEK